MKPLLILKRLLKNIDDKELEKMELWINNEDNIELVAVEEDSITLITDKDNLEINGKVW